MSEMKPSQCPECGEDIIAYREITSTRYEISEFQWRMYGDEVFEPEDEQHGWIEEDGSIRYGSHPCVMAECKNGHTWRADVIKEVKQ